MLCFLPNKSVTRVSPLLVLLMRVASDTYGTFDKYCHPQIEGNRIYNNHNNECA